MAVDATLVLGIIGNVTSMVMLLSPAPTIHSIIKNKSTKQFSGIPFVVTLFTCLLWIFYGTPWVTQPCQVVIITINGAGVLIGVVFIGIFLFYADVKIKISVTRLLATIVLTYGAIVCISFLVMRDRGKRKLLVGSICAVVTAIRNLAPLSVISIVVKTKSMASMPLLLTLFLFINAVVWTCYGAISHDIFILVTNSIGFVLGIVQLSLHGFYHNKISSEEVGHPVIFVKPGGELTNSVIDQKSYKGAAQKRENGATGKQRLTTIRAPPSGTREARGSQLCHRDSDSFLYSTPTPQSSPQGSVVSIPLSAL